MLQRIVLVCTILIGITVHSFGQEFKSLTNVETFKASVNKVAASTESISSSFVQEKHLSFMTEPITTKGRFAFQQPNLIRWEYKQPFSYILILDGDHILINDEGNTNAVNMRSNKMFSEINSILSNSLRGNVFEENGQFSYQIFQSKTHYKALLTPTTDQMKTYLESIELYFGKEDLIVETIQLNEKGGDYTKIKFLDKSLNVELAPSLFKL